MTYEQLSRKLIESDLIERTRLLTEHSRLVNAELAESLRQICYEVWTSEPQKVSAIVETLQAIEDFTNDAEISAYKHWTAAIENLVNGRLENCLQWLDESEKQFKNLGKPHAAATTQISKLYALALLGRYDEAVECGLRAREVFLAHEDFYSVGKIEHNIGNLFWRRDFYRESAPYLASAHKHFSQIGDQRQLAMVENCQAFVLALQNEFRQAEAIYEKALNRAAKHDLTVTAAEIETGMSNLYLFQGRYDLALKYMERSRQEYELLEMPHQTANCELEIADIYLELNLLPEAVAFYEQVETKYAEIGIQAELARSFHNHAKAMFALDDWEAAFSFLERAEKIYEAEGNAVAAASVKLSKGEFFFRRGVLDSAKAEAGAALQTFKKEDNRRFELYAECLSGEIQSRIGADAKNSETIFRSVLQKSAAAQLRPVEYRCLVSLGKLTGAEKYFLEAVDLIENSRATLAAEEFRAAFFADKLQPYNEIIKIKIAENKLVEALRWHERARSRVLAEMVSAASQNSTQNRKYSKLREELNWFYSRINRQTASGLEARNRAVELQNQAAKIERELAEIERRQRISEDFSSAAANEFDLEKFQSLLHEVAVVEFVVLDNNLKAFVIAENDFRVVSFPVDLNALKRETEQILFQIKSGRFYDKLTPENRAAAMSRLLRRAQRIYDALVRPIEDFCRKKRLVIAAADFLHYLPFQILHDGERFLIEKQEISYAPSLTVLQNCLSRKTRTRKKALLVGVADAVTPFVNEEIKALRSLFEESICLTDEAATLENLRRAAGAADVLHLACHGKFRLDNPDFSALNLFTGNLTVKDARSLDLRDKIVTLSACETGLNKIVSGEELFGLTRGFLGAGASSLILSLWTVSDRSTLELMKCFYEALLNGKQTGEALRFAQLNLLEQNVHPYFWSSFVLVGRW